MFEGTDEVLNTEYTLNKITPLLVSQITFSTKFRSAKWVMLVMVIFVEKILTLMDFQTKNSIVKRRLVERYSSSKHLHLCLLESYSKFISSSPLLLSKKSHMY